MNPARADIFRRIGYFTAASLIFLLTASMTRAEASLFGFGGEEDQNECPILSFTCEPFRFLNAFAASTTTQVTEQEPTLLPNTTASSSPVEETIPQQIETYTDPQGTFSIQYPSAWEVSPATNKFENVEVELSRPRLHSLNLRA